MKLTQLKHDIQSIVQSVSGNISLRLKTDEGEINIDAQTEKSAASVIKVPIALACLALVDQGKLNLDEKITINHPVAGTGVIHYLYGVQEITLKNALALSIIVSDNIAANIVIEAVGIDQANHFFKSVGAEHTHLRRMFMDHESLQAGIDNVTTASDMCTFLQLVDESDETLSKESKSLMLEILHHQQFKDKLPSYQNMFAEMVTIGNKTGTLDGVEHDVAYFKNEQSTAYIAVLSTNWEYNHDGQQAIARIGQKVLAYMS